MVSAVIEMHDFQCVAIEADEDRSFVLLDAYIHRSQGDPFIPPPEGAVQRIRMKVAA